MKLTLQHTRNCMPEEVCNNPQQFSSITE